MPAVVFFETLRQLRQIEYGQLIDCRCSLGYALVSKGRAWASRPVPSASLNLSTPASSPPSHAGCSWGRGWCPGARNYSMQSMMVAACRPGGQQDTVLASCSCTHALHSKQTPEASKHPRGPSACCPFDTHLHIGWGKLCPWDPRHLWLFPLVLNGADLFCLLLMYRR